jgi:hypothetical protein
MQVNKSNKNCYPSEDISENVADDQNSQNLDISCWLKPQICTKEKLGCKHILTAMHRQGVNT